MGIIVKSINKNGNKIIDYQCELNGNPLALTRDELIDKINNKEVDNARIQVYKGQVIIRVNFEKQDDTTKNNNKTTKTSQSKEKPDNSADIMISIAKEFGVKYINEYTNLFFEKNPTLKDKEFTSANIGERIDATREMVRFWRMVAIKQAEDKANHWYKMLDELEYIKYCQDNNLSTDEAFK